MKRKIDGSRVYKLIRMIVFIVCTPALIYSLWTLTIGVNKFEKYGHMCRVLNDSNCSIFDGKASDTVDRGFFFLVIGLGLPVFFGVTGLINYIAPVVKKNEKS